MTDKTPETATGLRGAAFAALLSILAFWALAFGVAKHRLGLVEGINPEGVQWALAFTAVLVLAVLVAALLADGRRFAALVRTVFLAACWVLALVAVYADWRGIPLWVVLTSVSVLAIAPAGLFAMIFLKMRKAAVPLPRAILAALVAVSVAGAGQIFLRPAPLLRAVDEAATLSFIARVEPRDYALSQDTLLEAQVTALADGRNGKPELFALLVAAYAGQSVFVSEAEGVRAILDGHFGVGPRSLVLGNSARHPLRYPDTDWSNLDQALAALSGRMGAEDMLFLYFTSHGNTDRLAMTFHPAAGRTEDLVLDAVGLSDLIDRHVTNPLVVVISACKSGSFLDDLAAEDRLIITASAADRVSFGCKDGADWTYFGREFFDTAMRAEPDPRRAFATALPLIEAAEAKLEWAEPSQPQISEGREIGPLLDALLAAARQ